MITKLSTEFYSTLISNFLTFCNINFSIYLTLFCDVTVSSRRHNVHVRVRGVPDGQVVRWAGAEEGLHRDQELHRSEDQSAEAEPSTGKSFNWN